MVLKENATNYLSNNHHQNWDDILKRQLVKLKILQKQNTKTFFTLSALQSPAQATSTNIKYQISGTHTVGDNIR